MAGAHEPLSCMHALVAKQFGAAMAWPGGPITPCLSACCPQYTLPIQTLPQVNRYSAFVNFWLFPAWSCFGLNVVAAEILFCKVNAAEILFCKVNAAEI